MVSGMSTRNDPAQRRRYTSTRRAQQAAQTRADILEAAATLFGERGWAGTTLQAVAAAAGVAVETVYSGFGSKRRLLHAALDAAIVGDTGVVPLSDRDEYQAIGRGSLDTRLNAGVRMLSDIHGRTARLWRAMRAAATADAEIAARCAEYEQRRHDQVADALSLVLGRAVDGPLLDLLWTYLGPEVYAQLVIDRSWPVEAYQEWMVKTVAGLTGDVRRGRRNAPR